MEWLLILAVGVFAVLGATWLWSARTSRARRDPFRARHEITIDEIYSTFYSDGAVDKARLGSALRELGGILNVPPGKLRPSDRFREELAPRPGWEDDDGLNVLSSLAEKKLVSRGLKPEAIVEIHTVDDYVRLFATTDEPT